MCKVGGPGVAVGYILVVANPAGATIAGILAIGAFGTAVFGVADNNLSNKRIEARYDTEIAHRNKVERDLSFIKNTMFYVLFLGFFGAITPFFSDSLKIAVTNVFQTVLAAATFLGILTVRRLRLDKLNEEKAEKAASVLAEQKAQRAVQQKANEPTRRQRRWERKNRRVR